jgi:FixJ family two-component response regulator
MPTQRNPIVESQSTVYVVDDDPDVCDGLRALLQSVGLKTVLLSSTQAFLTQKRSDDPSCLILDVRLPGSSGLDLQAELVKAKTSIPVIFMSGHGDIRMSVAAMKAGAVEFLTKPFREQDLLDAVRIALDRDRDNLDLKRRHQSVRSSYDSLTDREKQVMKWVCAGLMNKQTAAKIGISEITVKVHRHKVMMKLGVRSVPELVRLADSIGITP